RLAIMAATGAGAEVATLPAIQQTIDPNAGLLAAFDQGHARYVAARDAIKGLT
ncbi:MAG: xylulokinase, partial [Albidovulum sp.]